MECAKIYCRQNQLEQANAFLREAEIYKAPGLFIEQARLFWKKRKFPQAIQMLTSNCEVLEKIPGNENNPYLAKGLLMIARYNADAAVVDDKVNSEMFRKALRLDVEREKAYLFYADYLDRIAFLKEPEINTIEVTKLTEVLEAYGSCLIYGSNYVLQSLPRFLQIWFDATVPKYTNATNRKKSISSNNATLNITAKKFAYVLSPYQFYTAFSQIISRISHPCPEVFQVMKIIITKLINSYPEQSMWFIVHAMKSKVPSASDRMREILLPLKRDKSIIQDFSDFIDRIMDLSKIKEAGTSASLAEINRINSHLRRMKSRLFMPLQQNLQIYNNPVADNIGYQHIYMSQISEKITVMNSLQRPKKIGIIGSDGKEYPMLVKSKDDLRIDFRFMEVLKVLNDYFRKDRDASQRLFSVRTYTVIPINEEIGILGKI
jgi:serine/threonine-protein kinase ATR